MRGPRSWFRNSSDERLREWIRACTGAAILGLLWMAVVLPLLDRSPWNALPWTVLWSAVGLLAWFERRRRTTA